MSPFAFPGSYILLHSSLLRVSFTQSVSLPAPPGVLQFLDWASSAEFLSQFHFLAVLLLGELIFF